MNTFVIVAFFVLGISTIALELKKDHRTVKIFNLLLFTLIVQLVAPEFNEGSLPLLYGMVGIFGVNYIVAQLKLMQRPVLRIVVPLLSFVAFLFLSGGWVVEMGESSFLAVNKFLVTGTVVALLGYELGELKTKAIGKWFGGIEDKELMTSLLLFFTGVAVFLAMFDTPVYGVLLVTAAFMSASFYRNDDTQRVSVSLMILSSLPFLEFASGSVSPELLQGDVVEGMFLGAFSMYFIQKLWDAQKRNKLLIVLAYVLILLLAIGLFLSGGMFEKLGGADAFIGILFGIALVNVLLGKGFVATGLFTLLLGIGLVLSENIGNEELEQFESEMLVAGQMDEDGEVVAPELLPLDEIPGSYGIKSDSSMVSFVLGRKGETKGAFKKVSGIIKIGEKIEASSMSITLALEDFTTFVGARDKSLMGDEYFKADQFPKMTYKASGFVATGENTYKVNGDFTMLGVTQPVEVTLQRVKSGGSFVLIGEGTLDRRKFGMAPSESEGNIVTFNYQVILN